MSIAWEVAFRELWQQCKSIRDCDKYLPTERDLADRLCDYAAALERLVEYCNK